MAIDTEERNPKKDKSDSDKSNSNKKIVIIILSIIGVIVVLGIISTIVVSMFIKKGTESLIDNVTDGHVKIDSDGKNSKVTFKDEDGNTSTITTEKKLPKDFPKSSVPLYENAKLVSVSSYSSGNAGKVYTLGYGSQDSPEDVNEYYLDYFNDNDWTIMSQSSIGDSYMINSVDKSKGLSVILNVSSLDDKTDISITVREKN